jgi:ABC-type transporter MlaC component
MNKLKIFIFLIFINSISYASPYKTVQSYIDNLLTDNHENVAQFFHPDAFEFIRNSLLPVIELEVENKVEGSLAQQIFPSKSLDEIKAYSSYEFASKFIINIMDSFDHLRDILEIEILKKGVRDGRMIHFIVRISMVDDQKEWTNRRLDVVTVKKHGSKWKIYISDEIHGFIDIYRAKYDLPNK